MPGNSASRFAAIRSSSGTSVVPSPIERKRRSSSFGTLTRAVTSASVSGSRSRRRGSKTGWRCRERPPKPDDERGQGGEDGLSKRCSSSSRSEPTADSADRMRMPCSASDGRRSRSTQQVRRSRIPMTREQRRSAPRRTSRRRRGRRCRHQAAHAGWRPGP